MKSLLFLFCLLLALNGRITSEKFSFKGYEQWRLYPKNDEQYKFINELEFNDNNIDIVGVSHDNGVRVIDVIVPPENVNMYKKIFTLKGIKIKVLSSNIQELLDVEEESMKKSKNQPSILFKYARYNEINNYINTIADENEDIASKYLAGFTHENRQLQVLVLKTATSSRAIWIDCGIHAREWVTPSTCVFIIYQLIKEYRDFQPDTVDLLSKYEIHIMPLVNPDGYEYTHTTYRLWRKNRRPNPGSTCVGTDLNRNFEFKWMSGGASSDFCSDTYAGSAPESELETKAIVQSINKKLGQWDAFYSIHSKGQWWLTPYGYSTSDIPPDNVDILAAANIGADAIKNYNGSIFTVGPSSVLLYINSGSSSDWTYGQVNIKYSYVLELRPGAGTPDEIYSWALPEDRMPLVAHETYEGIKASLKYISNNKK